MIQQKFVLIYPDSIPNPLQIAVFESIAQKMNKALITVLDKQQKEQCSDLKNLIYVSDFSQSTIDGLGNDFDISIVVYIYEKRIKKNIMQFLGLCRNLRIPYIIGFTSNISENIFENVLAPISFLPEEKEKGAILLELSKIWQLSIHYIMPNDKGSRAKKNMEFILGLLAQQNVKLCRIGARNSSLKLLRDSTILNQENGEALLFILASRDYGLDDIIFGPHEYHAIKKRNSPVMLINPRDDLYMFCGS